MVIITVVIAVFLWLVCNELWWRHHNSHSELSRKFIHITVGSFVAFWPFILSWNQIRWLSLAFLIVVAISRYFQIFRAIHSVTRPTWGEVYFAVAVGAVTFITNNKWVYVAALLQMSLADGLAAIIGVRYGPTNRYHVLGQAKSVVGTLTFIIVSMVILAVFSHNNIYAITGMAIFGLATLAGVLENLGVFGLDNLLVPIFMATLLGIIA